MATKKVTISVDAERLDAIRALVAAGAVASTSAFFDHAAAVSLDDIAGWAGELDLALEATGGPLTDAERAWADRVLTGAA